VFVAKEFPSAKSVTITNRETSLYKNTHTGSLSWKIGQQLSQVVHFSYEDVETLRQNVEHHILKITELHTGIAYIFPPS
jgi:hypothetical protein